MHVGPDYIVNIQNASSKIFTVAFQSKQANSTESVIEVADDNIFEGIEYFRLRIVDVRFSGQAAALFRAVDGLNSTFVDVYIEDDECEFRVLHSLNLLQIAVKRIYVYVHDFMQFFIPKLLVSTGQSQNQLK